MEVLPEELKWEILSFLPIPSIFKSMGISKSFFSFSKKEEFWKRIFQQYPLFKECTKPKKTLWKDHCAETWIEMMSGSPYLQVQSSSGVTFANIIMTGECGAGKTSLMVRYIEDTFNPNNYMTIGVDFKIKHDPGSAEQFDGDFKLRVWEPAGEERFRTITRSYYRNAAGVVICCDVSKPDKLARLNSYIKEVEDGVSHSYGSESGRKCFVILVATKCDLIKHQFTKSEFEELAQKHPFIMNRVFVTSAKNNINVKEAFEFLTGHIVGATKMKKEYLEARKQKKGKEQENCGIL